jgi:DNA-binding transcriptional LysR family regulator
MKIEADDLREAASAVRHGDGPAIVAEWLDSQAQALEGKQLCLIPHPIDGWLSIFHGWPPL